MPPSPVAALPAAETGSTQRRDRCWSRKMRPRKSRSRYGGALWRFQTSTIGPKPLDCLSALSGGDLDWVRILHFDQAGQATPI